MKPLRIRLRHVTLGYPMRIELMIAESQPAVLPLNYGHHMKTHSDYLTLMGYIRSDVEPVILAKIILFIERVCFHMVGAQGLEP